LRKATERADADFYSDFTDFADWLRDRDGCVIATGRANRQDDLGATSRDVYLPPGDWYDWWTNAKATGGRTVTRPVDLATMPIFVRAGAIIPVDPVRQYTGEPVSEPTTSACTVAPTATSRSTTMTG
jgi:hypothetical protein